MSTLIFGIGNPYRGDDSIGWKVAGELRNRFKFKRIPLDIRMGNIGVFSLLGLSRNYERLVIIDAEEISNGRIGKIKFLRLADFNISSSPFSHLIDLKTAWMLWQKKFEYPKIIDVFTIQIKGKVGYTSCLSPALESKFPDIIKKISEKLESELKLSHSN